MIETYLFEEGRGVVHQRVETAKLLEGLHSAADHWMVERLFSGDGKRGGIRTESTSVRGDHYHRSKSLEECGGVRNIDTLLNGCTEDFDLHTSIINSGIADIKEFYLELDLFRSSM